MSCERLLLVVSAVCLLAANAGCGTSITCPGTGYSDGYDAGYEYGMAIMRAMYENTRSPNQLEVWNRHYRGQDLLSGPEDFAPGCADYFYEYTAGWPDGNRDANFDYQEELMRQYEQGGYVLP